MASLSANMIVDVEQYEALSTKIHSVCAKWDDAIKEYLNQLIFSLDTGLQEGSAAELFQQYISQVSKLKGQIKQIGQEISSEIATFLSDVDKADAELFKNAGHKPFTDEEFRIAFAAVDNTPELHVETIQSWISSLLGKFMKRIWKAADYDVKNKNANSTLVQRINDAKMETGEELIKVKIGVREADRLSQQRLKLIQTDLQSLSSLLQAIAVILEQKGEILTKNDIASINNHIEGLLDEKASVDATDQEVVEFAKNNESYFDSSTDVIESIATASIGQLITSDFDNYRTTVESARDFFNNCSKDFVSDREKFDNYKKAFDELLDLYQKYGSKWAEHTTNVSREKIELFDKIVKKTSAVSKSSEDYIDVWFSLFCDMSESQEAFERFRANCDLNKEGVQKAFQRIEDLYNHRVDAYLSETLEVVAKKLKDKAIKEGAKAAMDAYADYCSSLGAAPAGKIMKEIGGKVLDKAFAEAPAVAKLDWIEATQNSYKNAVAKLNATDPTSPEYSQLIEDVRTAFSAAKIARQDFFTLMAKSANGQPARFYKYNLEGIKTMSMNDIEAFDAISPEEYYGENASLFGYILDGDVTVSIK